MNINKFKLRNVAFLVVVPQLKIHQCNEIIKEVLVLFDADSIELVVEFPIMVGVEQAQKKIDKIFHKQRSGVGEIRVSFLKLEYLVQRKHHAIGQVVWVFHIVDVAVLVVEGIQTLQNFRKCHFVVVIKFEFSEEAITKFKSDHKNGINIFHHTGIDHINTVI